MENENSFYKNVEDYMNDKPKGPEMDVTITEDNLCRINVTKVDEDNFAVINIHEFDSNREICLRRNKLLQLKIAVDEAYKLVDAMPQHLELDFEA